MTKQTQSTVIDFEQATTPNTNLDTNTNINLPALPRHGVSRGRKLLPFLPFGSSTLWKWASEGKFIPPIKLSPTMTVWDNAKVHLWLESIAKGYDPELATQLATTPRTDIEGV